MLPVMVHVCLQTRGTVLQTASTAAWYLPAALPAPRWEQPCARAGSSHRAGGGGCLRLNKKGQQSSDVITALWGQGEIRVSWLVNNWAETGLCCCQQVAFTAARILHAMRVAAIVRLSTRAPPKVFLTVSFLQRGNVWPAARLDGVPWGFCKPQELPLFALCKVLGHVQDQSQGFSQWQVLCGNN